MTNRVIAGDYEGRSIGPTVNGLAILFGYNEGDPILLKRPTVTSYEVIDTTSQRSTTSAVGRALVGSLLVGPAGLLAGLTGKSKDTRVVAVEFDNGRRSLIQMDGRSYSAFIAATF